MSIMKKFMYLFLAGIMSTAMFSCDSANKDDGDGDKDNPVMVTGYVQPLSIEVKTSDPEYPKGVKEEIVTYTLDANKKITNVKLTSYQLISETETKPVDVNYPVTYKDNSVTVDCGDDVLIVYTMNDKGFPSKAEAKYASDGLVAGTYTFTYDKGMLTLVEDVENGPMFEATYDAKNNMLTFGGESGGVLTYGKVENHSTITVGLLPMYGISGSRIEGPVNFAVILGLIPQSELLPNSMTEMLITTKISDTGLLTDYKIGEMMNCVLKY